MGEMEVFFENFLRYGKTYPNLPSYKNIQEEVKKISEIAKKEQEFADMLENFCITEGITKVALTFLERIIEKDDNYMSYTQVLNFRRLWKTTVFCRKVPYLGPFYEWIQNPIPLEVLSSFGSFKCWCAEKIEILRRKMKVLKISLITELGLNTRNFKYNKCFIVGSGTCLINLLKDIMCSLIIQEEELKVFLIDGDLTPKEERLRESLKWEIFNLDNGREKIEEEINSGSSVVILIASSFWFSRGLMVRKGVSKLIQSLSNLENCTKIGCVGGFKHYIRTSLPSQPLPEGEMSDEDLKSLIINAGYEILKFKYLDIFFVT